MKSILTALAIILVTVSISLAATPSPGKLTIEFGCQSVKLHWGPADSAEFHPDGYIIYRCAETRYDWTQITPNLITDTSFVDYDLVIGDQFNYAVVAHYLDGNSSMSIGQSKTIYDPSQFDYFIVGDETSGDLNWWYYSKLDSLGLRGIIVNDVLPYCGDMLAELPLVVLVNMGDAWDPIGENPERETAIIDYLENGGRLYVHNAYQAYSQRLSQSYLGFDFTTCMPYPFTSIHGMPGTFSEGLRYSFSDTLFASGIVPIHFDSTEASIVLEDDVQCGCVDFAVHRNGYKAVVNSQPLERYTGHDTTGTMLTYFERMMEYFDILSSVDEDTPGQLPNQVSMFAYPNPFNSSVKIRLVNSDLVSDQTVSIFDIAGRQVRTITMPKRAGEVVWNGCDDSGKGLASGVYFARLQSDLSMPPVMITLLK